MGFGTLIQRITYRISGRTLASSGLYTPSTYSYDYALGGVPFLSATSDTRPDTEKPVQQRKQQFDNYKDPGEYSLNQWWLRSQTSFVGGEGVIYQDPDTQGTTLNVRYAHGIGVDPFSDPDFLSLLHRSVQTNAATDATTNVPIFSQAWEGGTGNDVVLAKGRTVYTYAVGAGALTLSNSFVIPYGGSGSFGIKDGIVVIDKPNSIGGATAGDFYVVYQDAGTAANNGIWHFDGTLGTSVRQYIASSTARISKARGLLATGIANSFYMLNPYAGANTALPAANATIPAEQVIVGAVDGPDAVYVAANDAFNGFIYKSTFDAAGLVNGLTLTAVLPVGERINAIAAYVNTNLIISTETGIRVGQFTGTGVVYGPSIITSTKVAGSDPSTWATATSGFGRIAFRESLALITTLGGAKHDGYKGLMAVDLSTIVNDNNTGAQTNAYATWLYFPGSADRVIDVTVCPSGQTVWTTGFSGTANVYLEHATELIDQGYLDTGRCRFNTIEPKLFKYFSVKTPVPLMGDVNVSIIDDTGGVTSYITYGPTFDPGTNDIATPTPGGPRNYESLRFTLKRNPTNANVGGQLDSWQVKALPGTLKQRVITRNFLCFNSEKDKTGNLIAGDTLSLDRLTSIRQMCQRGDTVTFQDLVNNISDQVIIDDYQFTMLTTPGPNGENYGGYLTVEMRTVADSVPPVSLAGSVEEE